MKLLVSLFLGLVWLGSTHLAGSAAPELPARLSDQEFWKLTEEISEPDGTFQSDNLLSNELVFARTVPALSSATKPDGVYLGVGPEQNFTYIAAMKPRMAFITDIRRGNLHLQLMYKALFELSADRAEFVSRLFTKKRPAGLTAASTSTELMNAYWEAFSSDEAAFQANLRAVIDQLTVTHAFPLSAGDLDGIANVYRAFYWYGPSMTYSARTDRTSPAGGSGTSYWTLMTQSSPEGEGLSYLGSEARFHVVKTLEASNLLVPIVGNFSGPKALRAVGNYLRTRNATVTAFYVSNVEGYLRQDGSWSRFCANVASMPLDDASVFLRPSGTVRFTVGVPGAPPPNPATGAIVTAPRVTLLNGQPVPASQLLGTYTPTGSGLLNIAAEVKSCGGTSY